MARFFWALSLREPCLGWPREKTAWLLVPVGALSARHKVTRRRRCFENRTEDNFFGVEGFQVCQLDLSYPVHPTKTHKSPSAARPRPTRVSKTSSRPTIQILALSRAPPVPLSEQGGEGGHYGINYYP